MTTRRVVAGVATVVAFALAGCASDPVPAPRTPSTGEAGPSPSTAVRLEKVAEMEAPVALAVRPGEPANVYIAEKAGRVRVIRSGKLVEAPVLDITSETSDGSEQGLLGLAFSPAGVLYVDYTDRDGDIHVDEVDLASGRRRSVLTVGHSDAPNHNGGQLAFGPDGMLYVAIGDGGGGGDPDGNGQKLTTRLGKILRVDPTPAGARPFSVPSGNPFAGRAGADPLIWHLGLRNPWRFSFDRVTGDMWIADVGQGEWEEIDRAPAGVAGKNFGWNIKEGTHDFEGNTDAELTDPVHEYDHGDGACSVTGGYVYRGAALPQLTGAYLFGDFCVGQLMALRAVEGGGYRAEALGLAVTQLASFGEDADGELWVLSLEGEVHRIVAA